MKKNSDCTLSSISATHRWTSL